MIWLVMAAAASLLPLPPLILLTNHTDKYSPPRLSLPPSPATYPVLLLPRLPPPPAGGRGRLLSLRCRATTAPDNDSSQPPPPPPPFGDDDDPLNSLSGWQSRFSRFQDRVRIFVAVLFWMSLFFWGSAWDGRNNSGSKKRRQSRKK